MMGHPAESITRAEYEKLVARVDAIERAIQPRAVVLHGQYKGKAIEWVLENDAQYICWIQEQGYNLQRFGFTGKHLEDAKAKVIADGGQKTEAAEKAAGNTSSKPAPAPRQQVGFDDMDDDIPF